jgi:hypothetical protein
MNHVTFKINETQEGEFILFLYNHSREIVIERFRSKDLDEVVSRLKEDMKYRKGFKGALNNMVSNSILDEGEGLGDE